MSVTSSRGSAAHVVEQRATRRPQSRSRVSAKYALQRPPRFGLIDAREKRRDHLAQLGEHLVARTARTSSSGMRAHAQQERLEALACSVDADVRLRRRGQHAAQRVERLRADRRSMHAFGVLRRLAGTAREMPLHRGRCSRA